MNAEDQSCLFVFGGQSTALEILAVANVVERKRPIKLVRPDGEEDGSPQADLSASELAAFTHQHPGKHGFIIGMSHRGHRQRWLELATKLDLEPASVIHPSATIADGAVVGPGTYLAANAVVSNNARIDGHCLINYNVVIGHDTRLGSHVVINPGASIGGSVSLADGVLIGANAFVHQGLSIGSGASIDALTYVDQDVPEGKVVSCRTSSPRQPAPLDSSRKDGISKRDCKNALLVIINRIRENNNHPPVESITDETKLREDLGMDSLTLAEFTVNVEALTGVDVFAQGLVSTIAEVEERLCE